MVDIQLKTQDVYVISGRVVPSVLKEHISYEELKEHETISKYGHRLYITRLPSFLGTHQIGSKLQYYYGLNNAIESINPIMSEL